MAILSRYFSLYEETYSAGYAGFSLPSRVSWCRDLHWTEPVEPPDWEDRVKELDRFRKEHIRKLISQRKKSDRPIPS
jgi:hypothetical protein